MLTIAGSMELWPRSSARREIRTMWLMSLGGSVRPRPHRGHVRIARCRWLSGLGPRPPRTRGGRIEAVERRTSGMSPAGSACYAATSALDSARGLTVS